MHRSATGGGLVLFAAVALALSAPAAAEAQALGRLYIEALDGDGQVVPGLTTSDFVVLEDDTRVNIVSVEQVGPMKVALLLDNSDRMSQLAALYPLRDATEVFLDTLGPEHEVALFTIARNLQRRVDFATDREELKASAEEIFLDSGAGTPLLDGIRETWERHYDGEETLPVMVLMLTDGPENSSNYSDTAYAEFVETLIVDGVMVNVLQLSGGSRGSSASSSVMGVRPQHRRQHRRRVRDLLRRDRHGGVDARYAEHLNAHHAEVSKRYRVLYEPPDPRGAQISAGARQGVNIRLFVDLRAAEQ